MNTSQKLLIILTGLLMGLPLWAQSDSASVARKPSLMEWHRNAAYRIKYKVPADWTLVKQGNDTISVATYVSPEQDMILFIGKRRDAAHKLTPEEALKDMLKEFQVKANRIFPTHYNGINFVETTGSDIVRGHLVQYDAMAAHHRGHIILVYVYASDKAYQVHKNILEAVIHSITPYRGN